MQCVEFIGGGALFAEMRFKSLERSAFRDAFEFSLELLIKADHFRKGSMAKGTGGQVG